MLSNLESIKWDVFNIIKEIKDPEFDQSLEELNVIQLENISIIPTDEFILLYIIWVPTVEHCSYASQIGLAINWKLENELENYQKYKLKIEIAQGKHKDEKNLNKQINDKERIEAAKENPELYKFISSLFNFQNQ